tara:strand:+ start:2441 stop:2734 length:294 start_codon:yes stop_codon:yes gene_type:complete
MKIKSRTIEVNVQIGEPRYFTNHYPIPYSSVDYGTKTLGLFLNGDNGWVFPDFVLKEGEKGQLSKIRELGGGQGLNLIITFDENNTIVNYEPVRGVK